MNKRTIALVLLIACLFGHRITWAKHISKHKAAPATQTATCTKTSSCFSFSYKGFQVSLDGKQVTLSFSIKTNCDKDLSYAAFGLPAASTADAKSGSKYTYTTSITSNPFYSIKYEGVGINGYKSGVSDVFSYTLPKSEFDKLTTIKVQAKAGTNIGTVTFDKVCQQTECIVSDAALSGVKYYANGSMSTDIQKVAVQGKPVKVCFTVAASAGKKTFSFVSYKAPYPYFVRAAAHQQVLFDYKTIVVGPEGGTFCLEIAVPDCYYQVDFVKGCIIVQFGPADTNPNNFYGAQKRLLSAAEGGITPCVPNETTGNEGCTPGYWKQEQHFGSWAPSVPTGLQATKFFDVFTVCDQNGNGCNYRGLYADLTLLQALSLQGGGFNALARHAAAAYLSASSDAVDYGIKKVDVVKNVIDAFKSGNTGYKSILEAANEKYCPLGRSEVTTSAVSASGRAGIPETNGGAALLASPNPFTGTTTISFTLPSGGRYELGLFDAKGGQVRNLKTGVGKAGEQIQVRLESAGLGKGLYMVQLVSSGGAKSMKLLLQ